MGNETSHPVEDSSPRIVPRSKIRSHVGNRDGDRFVSDNACRMSPSVAEDLSRGIRYNLKIVIRGESHTGKSTLFKMLQEQLVPMSESTPSIPHMAETKTDYDYNPTKQLQVANIRWCYRSSEEAVKLELWDVVDQGKGKRLSLSTQAFSKTRPGSYVDPVDASSLSNLYYQTHGIIVMINRGQSSSLDYAISTMKNVPRDMPVLMIGAFGSVDPRSSRTVDASAEEFVRLNRSTRTGALQYATCEDLRAIKKSSELWSKLSTFLEVAFLELRLHSMRLLIQTNEEELKATVGRLESRGASHLTDTSKTTEEEDFPLDFSFEDELISDHVPYDMPRKSVPFVGLNPRLAAENTKPTLFHSSTWNQTDVVETEQSPERRPEWSSPADLPDPWAE